jgi:hypothetical protein
MTPKATVYPVHGHESRLRRLLDCTRTEAHLQTLILDQLHWVAGEKSVVLHLPWPMLVHMQNLKHLGQN